MNAVHCTCKKSEKHIVRYSTAEKSRMDFQFDWREEGLVVGGIYYRLQVAHIQLCASRAFWLVAYPGLGYEMLFDAHTRSFTALGGIPRRGIYDNMKTAVDKVKKGKGRRVNERFSNFTELNAWLGTRCRALWAEVRHPEYEQFGVAEAAKY